MIPHIADAYHISAAVRPNVCILGLIDSDTEKASYPRSSVVMIGQHGRTCGKQRERRRRFFVAKSKHMRMLTSQSLPTFATPEQWHHFIAQHLATPDEAAFIYTAIGRTTQAALMHYATAGLPDPEADAWALVHLLQLQQGIGHLLGLLQADESTPNLQKN